MRRRPARYHAGRAPSLSTGATGGWYSSCAWRPPRPAQAATPRTRATRPSGSLGALALGALGVVFGDIGTSPLYTLQVGIAPEGGGQPEAADVLGVCSLIVWALTMVVTVKYLAFVMRADNRGEGGILALLALVPETERAPRGSASSR